jgi:RimJ/RimL family protein N-acetyltransferase
MFFRSERLFLRPAWPEDRDVVLRELSQHIPAAARSSFPASFLAGLEGAQSACARDPHLPGFLIAVPAEGSTALVGFAGLIERAGGIDLACWIARGRRGMGYGTECLKALVHIARMLGCVTVGAESFLDDPAFGQVLRKVGFLPTGKIILRQSRRSDAIVPAMRYQCELLRAGDRPDGQTGPNKAATMQAA